MYTFVGLSLLLAFAVAAVLLHYQLKHKRLHSFKRGICPDCNAKPVKFYDQAKDITLTKTPIVSRVLRKSGCSGASVIEYRCKECEIKEVFSENGGGCGL